MLPKFANPLTLATLFFAFPCSLVLAQTKPNSGQSPEEQAEDMRDVTARSAALEAGPLISPGRSKKKMSREEKELLRPPAYLKSTYASFLRMSHTGIVRILPKERYNGKLSINGGGSYFSFDRRDQEYGFGSDIGFQDDQFVVGLAGADFGYIVQLGNIAIDGVDINSPELQPLTSIKPPSKDNMARDEYRQSVKGVHVNELYYARKMPAVENMTYGLRSILYNKSDLLVVFRVIKKDSDGSLVLVWRILKRKLVPTLKRQ
jgi:hypothetical protein